MLDLEQFFKSMDYIVEKKLETLKYDQTVVCKVVDASKAAEGQYRVSDDSSTFNAYSNGTEYKEGTKVYVLIPNGDFDNDKMIVGKYKADETVPYNYISPMDSFVDLTGDIIDNSILSSTGLTANNEEVLKTKICSVILINPTDKEEVTAEEGADAAVEEEPQVENQTPKKEDIDTSGFDRLGIQASFITNLHAYNLKSGDYGIAAIAILDDDSRFILDMSSKEDMIGDIYNFGIPTPQSKVFDISGIGRPIKQIDFYLYQNNNFVNINGVRLKPFKIGDIYQSNIQCTSLELRFGYDTKKYQETTALLWSGQDKVYSRKDVNRTLRARFIYVDENGNQYAIDDKSAIGSFGYALPDIFKIHWYKRVLEEGVEDPLAGRFWREITPDNDDQAFDLEVELNNPKIVQQEHFKIIVELDDPTISDSEVSFAEYYHSEELIFQNEDDVMETMLDLISALHLECDQEGLKGIYNIYLSNGDLMNRSEAFRSRKIVAKYRSVITGDDSIEGSEAIYWYFPNENCMFTVDNPNGYYTELTSTESDKYRKGYTCYFNPNPMDNSGETIDGTEMSKELSINFKINEQYIQTFTNNTIECIVYKNGQPYTASAAMVFGTSGTNGTDYTFLLEKDKEGFFANSEKDEQNEQTVKFIPKLFDYNNKEIEINKAKVEYDIYFDNGDGKDKASLTNGQLKLTKEAEEESYKPYCAIVQAKYAVKIEDSKKEDSKDEENDENKKTESRNIILTAYAQVPWYKQENYHLSGATKVVYNSTGTNPSYYKEEYKLYTDDDLSQCNNVKWSLEQTAVEKAEIQYDRLKPSPIYFTVTQKDRKICVKAEDKTGLLAMYPILILQNTYGSSLLNTWDGKLQIKGGAEDEDSSILAATIGAGKKNADNQFTGVLMGQVESNGETNMGLFGYSEGAESFGFKENGTAFIGKSGAGRIEFDGKNGVIQSGNWKSKGMGMCIDLDNAFIRMKGESSDNKITSIIELNAQPDPSNAAFKIGFKDGNSTSWLLVASPIDKNKNDDKGKFYLQTKGYDDKKENSDGMKIDLVNNTLVFKKSNAYINENTKETLSGNFSLGIGDYLIDIGSSSGNSGTSRFNAFQLKWDGSLSIGNGKFSVDNGGNITAISGNIGGFTLTANYFLGKPSSKSSGGGGVILCAEPQSIKVTPFSGGDKVDKDYVLAVGKISETENGKIIAESEYSALAQDNIWDSIKNKYTTKTKTKYTWDKDRPPFYVSASGTMRAYGAELMEVNIMSGKIDDKPVGWGYVTYPNSGYVLIPSYTIKDSQGNYCTVTESTQKQYPITFNSWNSALVLTQLG